MTLSDECKAYRKDGKLVIEIPEDGIVAEVGKEDIPFSVVTDAEVFLNHVAKVITRTEHEHEDFETNLEHMVRAAIHDAGAKGLGVQERPESDGEDG